MWVFAYGSLIFRPDFPHEARVRCFLPDHERRFYQGSTDHRGVPGAPGRVVTLVPAPGARCWGLAYKVREAEIDAVLARLDHREKGGYTRKSVSLQAVDAVAPLDAIVYLAEPGNPNWLGPAPLAEMAAQIRAAHGPSGANKDYLSELARVLEEAEVVDEAVRELLAAIEG